MKGVSSTMLSFQLFVFRKRVKFLDESNKPEEEFLDSSTLLTELKSDDISIVPEELQGTVINDIKCDLIIFIVTDPVITKQDTPSDAPSEAPPKSSLPFYPFYLPDPILRDPSQRTTTFSILKKRNRKRIYIEKNSNQEYECKKVLFKRSTINYLLLFRRNKFLLLDYLL